VPLTLAAGPYLAEHGFLHERGSLVIGRAHERDGLERFVADYAGLGAHVELVDRAAMAALVPGLLPEWTAAVWQPGCADIDVAGLHQHYLARARQAGSVLRVRAQVGRIEKAGGLWEIGWRTAGQDVRVRAALVANAAGAWADTVAGLAGAPRLGIAPLRRTIVQLRLDGPVPATLPLTFDLAGEFYFKPSGDRLWLSPHDETPDVPCDAAPEEYDVALAIDRMSRVVDWQVQAVERRWAGLRSFAPDRAPVYGFDADVPGFFWFAGQGGFGIQTAPAAARLGAQLLLGQGPDEMTASLDPAAYAPGRLRLRCRSKRQRKHRGRTPSGFPLPDHAPFARRQPVERPVSDLPAHEAQGRVADGGGHPADLPVAPLAQGQADPAIGHALAKAHRRVARPERGRIDPFGPRGQGHPVVEAHPARKRIERGCVGLALDLHEVGLGGLEARVGDAGLKPPVVGQQEQPLAVAVEPPGRIDAGPVHIVGQRRARRPLPSSVNWQSTL
jgi:D-arginine dehydrogenase